MLDSQWSWASLLFSAFMFLGSCFIHLKTGDICWHAKLCQRGMRDRPSSLWHRERVGKYLGQYNSRHQAKRRRGWNCPCRIGLARFGGVQGGLTDLRTPTTCSSSAGLLGRCSGVYQAKNGLIIGLTDLQIGFVDLATFLLRSKSFVNHRRASPCGCMVQILFSVNSPHMLLHQLLSSLHIERNISTCWNKDQNWPKIEWKCKLTKAELWFSVGDQVLLRLQPYTQSLVANQPFPKLSYKFFGPYKVLERIGTVTYRLELPTDSRIHPVSHISQLKQFHPDYTPAFSNHWFTSHRSPTSNNP
jgi:hypothetical protein